jgi:DNA invertase Pin-like site-specific DNA recombinase
MKAIGYIRFSSDEQGNGDSIGRQTSNIQSYCQRNALALEKTLTDDGYSASKGHHITRGKLGKFLKEADSGKYRGFALVVEELDRLSRLGISLTDALIERILKAGLVIHVTQENRVIKSLDDLMTAIFNAVKNYGAKDYTDKLSAWVTAGQADRKAKWKNGEIKVLTALLPAWLEAKDGKICPVKVASGSGKMRKIPASVVVAIFRFASQGYGAPKILRQLNGGLSQVWINKTLRNRAVLGEFVSKGELVHDYYPRIIDETLWQAARAAIDSHNRMTGEQRKRCVLGRSSDGNLFPGLLYDVTIPGKAYSLWYQKRSANEIFLVTNTAQAAKGEVHRIRYDRFEAAFLRIVSELNWQKLIAQGEPPELTTALVKQTELTNEVATLQSLINVRRTALDTAADIEAVNQTAASLKRLEDKQAIVRAELETVTAEIDASRSKLASLENPRGLLDILDQPEKRAQLRLEIAKRISKIEVIFGPEPWLILYFGNAVTGFFPVDKDAPPIPPLSSLPGNGYQSEPFEGGYFGDGDKLMELCTPDTLTTSHTERETPDVTLEMVKDFIRGQHRTD